MYSNDRSVYAALSALNIKFKRRSIMAFDMKEIIPLLELLKDNPEMLDKILAMVAPLLADGITQFITGLLDKVE